MKIVVDSGVDLFMSRDQMTELNIHQVPLSVTFKGKTYREGLDITREQFYSMLSESSDFPIPSQPSPGLIAETYKEIAATDPISCRYTCPPASAEPSTRLNWPPGWCRRPVLPISTPRRYRQPPRWQAIAAARAIKLGQSKEQALALMKRISDSADSIFTLKELRYLVHGGRISHIKGLLASVLKIKPMFGVEKVNGKYVQMGQARDFKQAIEGD
jgi:fatty acid-binding protein DegV